MSKVNNAFSRVLDAKAAYTKIVAKRKVLVKKQSSVAAGTVDVAVLRGIGIADKQLIECKSNVRKALAILRDAAHREYRDLGGR